MEGEGQWRKCLGSRCYRRTHKHSVDFCFLFVVSSNKNEVEKKDESGAMMLRVISLRERSRCRMRNNSIVRNYWSAFRFMQRWYEIDQSNETDPLESPSHSVIHIICSIAGVFSPTRQWSIASRCVSLANNSRRRRETTLERRSQRSPHLLRQKSDHQNQDRISVERGADSMRHGAVSTHGVSLDDHYVRYF